MIKKIIFAVLMLFIISLPYFSQPTDGAMNRYIEGYKITDPSAPAANYGRLYFRDNGSGKTQLVVRFPTGTVQVIATEP